MKFELNKSRALSLEDMLPIIGEGTILYRKYKYEPINKTNEITRSLAVSLITFYQSLVGLTLLSNYEVFF